MQISDEMRVWFDTEFIEDGKTIELVSIGMVREDGATYYAEVAGVDYSRADPWLHENVFVHLQGGDAVKTKDTIALDIVAFVGPKPEFWAYYADYDWVALCQLYGRMIDLPTGWPMFCRDLIQESAGRKLPKQDGVEHHALADALWTKLAHAALSLPVQPVAWLCEGERPGCWREGKHVVFDVELVAKRMAQSEWWKVTPLYANPVPPTKGPEDDLIAAREAAKEAGGEHSYVAVQSALIAIRNERSRPASALPVVGEPPAWADVIAERKRQVDAEGWTPKHDDEHKSGQLATAAACYIEPGFRVAKTDENGTVLTDPWPWWDIFDNGDRLYRRVKAWWKPTTRRADLVKAGALILAEIERLDRADALTPSVQP